MGFSLTPHLRIDEVYGNSRENQGEDHREAGFLPHRFSVMPLRSDGSLCVADPFRHSSALQGIIACHYSYSISSSELVPLDV